MAEMATIVKRLKELGEETKKLRLRKKELEVGIYEFLSESGTPGIKYHELVVIKSETITHARLKKNEKEAKIIQVLESQGIADPAKAYEAIQAAAKGAETTQPKLRVKTVFPELF